MEESNSSQYACLGKVLNIAHRSWRSWALQIDQKLYNMPPHAPISCVSWALALSLGKHRTLFHLRDCLTRETEAFMVL